MNDVDTDDGSSRARRSIAVGCLTVLLLVASASASAGAGVGAAAAGVDATASAVAGTGTGTGAGGDGAGAPPTRTVSAIDGDVNESESESESESDGSTNASNGTVAGASTGTTGTISVVVEAPVDGTVENTSVVDGEWEPVTTADDGVGVDVRYVNDADRIVTDGTLLPGGTHAVVFAKPGRYRIEANVTGTAYRSTVTNVSLDGGESLTVDLYLDRKDASVGGAVVDGDGTGLAGASVALDEAGDGEFDPVARTTTGFAGTYAFENVTPADDYRVVAGLAGERDAVRLGPLDGGDDADAIVTLPEAEQSTRVRVVGPAADLASYDLAVRSSVATLTGVDARGDARVVDGGTGTRAVDLVDEDVAGDGSGTATLATLTFRGSVEADEVDLAVTGLSSEANASVNRTDLRLVSDGAELDDGSGRVFERGIPGVSDVHPRDVDADGALEDVDGDGEATFRDVVELVFVDPSVVEGPRRTAALDFDDDGDFDLLDVVALLYEV